MQCSECQSGEKQARVNGESNHDNVIAVQCSLNVKVVRKQARVNGESQMSRLLLTQPFGSNAA